MPGFYKPVKDARFFTRNVKYSGIDWNDFPRTVQALHVQIEDWYLRPVKHLRSLKGHQHYAFTVVALASMLIDTLSQYEEGLLESNGERYKQFLRSRIPGFDQVLNPPIRYLRNNHERTANDVATAFYVGFRCGILHETHVTLFGGLTAQGNIVEIHPAGFTTYTDTAAPCPTISIEAFLLFDAVKAAFEDYIGSLLNPAAQFEPLRQNFRSKFARSYGIDIGNEP